MKTSKAMVLEGPRRMVAREFPLPHIGPEEALLRVEMVGVCGSDVGIYRGKTARAPRPYPIIMGHEVIGRIAEIGKRGIEASGPEGRRPGDCGVRLRLREMLLLHEGGLYPLRVIPGVRVDDFLQGASSPLGGLQRVSLSSSEGEGSPGKEGPAGRKSVSWSAPCWETGSGGFK